MGLFQRLHHAEIIIPKGKEEEARAFYCDLLGFREVEKPDVLKKNGGLWIELGANQVHLSIDEGYDPAKTKAHLAYEVSDIQKVKELLGSRGINMELGVGIPGYVRGNIRDPFGNRMEFLQKS
jgi:catechol 2,3-dioxygenase-like lactoylglutathione lyase family enzyme